MSKATLKTYQLLLYLGQFVVSPDALLRLSDALPRTLSSLHITDEGARISLIEHIRTFINDFREAHYSESPLLQLKTGTVRKFIRHFLLVLGVLSVLAPLTKNSNKLMLNRTSATQYATTAALLTSAMPLLRTRVPDAGQAGFVLTALSLSVMPEGYPKDYASIYALCQGIEAWIQKHKATLPVNVQSSWVLMPLCLSQILHLISTSPGYLPGTFTRPVEFLYGGLVERKPVWYNAEWPQTLDVFVKMQKARKVDRGLIHSEVVLTRTNPVHKNVRMAIMSPSEPSIATVLKKHLPLKATLFFLGSLPLFYLYERYTTSVADTTTDTTPSSAALSSLTGSTEEYDQVSDINAEVITKSTFESSYQSIPEDVVAYSPLPRGPNDNILTRTVRSAGKFTVTTLLSLVTSYILFTTKLSPRLNGLISGLWWCVYRESANGALLSYLARITLLSTFRQKKDRWRAKPGLKHMLANSSSTLIGAFSMAVLIRLQSEGRDLGRFGKYLKVIRSGTGVLKESLD